MQIKVLGAGCPKCKTLENLTQDVVADMGLDATITKEDDIMKIIEYGVMRTPALVINEKLVMSGRIPSLSEIKNLIIQNLEQ